MRAYSLMNLGSRLAVDGEELVAHRFPSGSIGMVPRSDFESWLRSTPRRTVLDSSSGQALHRGLLQSIKNTVMEFLTYYGFKTKAPPSPGEPGPVVGIPSEALLRVFGISPDWQEQYHLGSFEDALFIESSSSSDARHDALCFGNGITIPLQFLHEGQKLKVLRRFWADSLEPDPARAGLKE